MGYDGDTEVLGSNIKLHPDVDKRIHHSVPSTKVGVGTGIVGTDDQTIILVMESAALCLAGDVTPVLPPPTSGTKAAALASKNWDSPYYIALGWRSSDRIHSKSFDNLRCVCKYVQNPSKISLHPTVPKLLCDYSAFHTFGQMGKFLVELCIIGFLMGTCIAFFVVVGDLGPVIISKTFGINDSAALRPSVLIGLAFCVVLPLGMLRNVDSLSSICTATVGFYICLVLKVNIVFAEALPHLLVGDWLDKVYLWRPSGILQCIPIFSMALFCQTQLFEIYESVPNASLEQMNDLIRKAVNICTSVYICVGFFGYIAFCTDTFTGNILMNFSPSLMSDVIKLGFVLSVAVSFPLVIFPCRASLYSLLFRRVQMPHHEGVSTYIPEARFKCITVFIISCSLVIGLLIPNIELVLGLVGSTIGVLICVMFPAVVFIRVSTKSTNDRHMAQVILFVGVLILVLGTYATLYAANEAVVNLKTDMKKEVVSIRSDLISNLVDFDKNSNNERGEDTKNQQLEAKVKLKEAFPEGKIAQTVDKDKLEIEAKVKKEEKNVQDEEKKLDVRQEPPVPVEPVVKPVEPALVQPSFAPAEKKEEEKLPPPIVGKVEVPQNPSVQKIDNGNDESKKVANIPEQVINQDAIKKEEEELAEAEKQADADGEKKKEELLRKLEKHQEEQKKLLQEQKQILEELKVQKKEIEREKEEREEVQGNKAKKVDEAKKDNKTIRIDNVNNAVIQSADKNVDTANKQTKIDKETHKMVKSLVNNVEPLPNNAEVLKNNQALPGNNVGHDIKKDRNMASNKDPLLPAVNDDHANRNIGDAPLGKMRAGANLLKDERANSVLHGGFEGILNRLQNETSISALPLIRSVQPNQIAKNSASIIPIPLAVQNGAELYYKALEQVAEQQRLQENKHTNNVQTNNILPKNVETKMNSVLEAEKLSVKLSEVNGDPKTDAKLFRRDILSNLNQDKEKVQDREKRDVDETQQNLDHIADKIITSEENILEKLLDINGNCEKNEVKSKDMSSSTISYRNELANVNLKENLLDITNDEAKKNIFPDILEINIIAETGVLVEKPNQQESSSDKDTNSTIQIKSADNIITANLSVLSDLKVLQTETVSESTVEEHKIDNLGNTKLPQPSELIIKMAPLLSAPSHYDLAVNDHASDIILKQLDVAVKPLSRDLKSVKSHQSEAEEEEARS
uniref:(California timema) hypothetical protein n=1 Tax=Timema californicum TaxID=61474 RepID=A0A7R9IZJ9_TIMCA|nr:unnamed protein product [Timema californicum]